MCADERMTAECTSGASLRHADVRDVGLPSASVAIPDKKEQRLDQIDLTVDGDVQQLMQDKPAAEDGPESDDDLQDPADGQGW